MRFGRVGFGEVVDQDADLLREARVTEARKNRLWAEIPDDLVPRGPGLLVSAATDDVFAPHGGVIWETDSANAIADYARLSFYVNADNECVFVEPTGQKWSEIVARKAKRERSTA